MHSGRNNNGQGRMAELLTQAMQKAHDKGVNTGRVGHRILTNNAKNGLNGKPAQRKAVSAGSVSHG